MYHLLSPFTIPRTMYVISLLALIFMDSPFSFFTTKTLACLPVSYCNGLSSKEKIPKVTNPTSQLTSDLTSNFSSLQALAFFMPLPATLFQFRTTLFQSITSLSV
uniref:Uncharacterized protein n=1 Tax=Micrurus spixii TaxID=129469 RepID=A0A2D4NB23_9SAUR